MENSCIIIYFSCLKISSRSKEESPFTHGFRGLPSRRGRSNQSSSVCGSRSAPSDSGQQVVVELLEIPQPPELTHQEGNKNWKYEPVADTSSSSSRHTRNSVCPSCLTVDFCSVNWLHMHVFMGYHFGGGKEFWEIVPILSCWLLKQTYLQTRWLHGWRLCSSNMAAWVSIEASNHWPSLLPCDLPMGWDNMLLLLAWIILLREKKLTHVQLLVY